MKVVALFVCGNDQLYDAVNANRERLIPEALRRRWADISYAVIPIKIPLTSTEAEFINTIENAADGFDGVALLVPTQLSATSMRCRDAFFVVDYVNPHPVSNVQNQLSALLQRTLRDFSLLMSKVAEMKYKRSLLLPLNDFTAPVMDRTRILFRELSDEQQFARALEGILRDFRQRQVPTRVAKDEIHPVYVDCDGKRFDRGREKHARAGTAIPPHDVLCGLNKAFRFGFAYPDELHFNVAVGDDTRAHRFHGCHGPHGISKVNRKSHANVFPNGDVT